MTGREILSAIERGCLDPEIRGIAAGYYASAAATALGNDPYNLPPFCSCISTQTISLTL